MPAGNTLARLVLAQTRLGDGTSTQVRPLSSACPLTYTISVSQYAAPCGLTYTIQKAGTAPLLLYAVIAPQGNFAINGDASIVAPDQLNYAPRPVSARTLIAEPLLQGYKQMTWSYSALLLAEYAHLVSFYDPQNPVVLLTYPDETGAWIQKQAVMRPPSFGTQTTIVYTGVVLTFTRLN